MCDVVLASTRPQDRRAATDEFSAVGGPAVFTAPRPRAPPATGPSQAANSWYGVQLVCHTTCVADDFLDREAELQALDGAWETPGAVLALVWGRRRTGKTRLLGKFLEGKRAIFYGATQQASPVELRGLSGATRMRSVQQVATSSR